MASTLEQLDKALAAHSMWKHRLRDLVENGTGDIDAKTAMRDDACEMGKWLRGFKPSVGEQPFYNAVCARHTQFHEAVGKVVMLADGAADFAKKIGLDMDLSARGLGVRSKRYAMAVEDGVVKVLNIEDQPGQVASSSAETLCSMVDKSL